MEKIEVFLDAETLPTADAELRESIEDSITPPKTMSKAETIAAWEANEKPKLVEEAILKTALDGTYGRIFCLCYAFNDEEVESIYDPKNEAKVIKHFFEACRKTNYDQLTLVGHGLRDFDLRFIWQRAVIHNIPRPLCLPFNVSKYDPRIIDTMEMWNPNKEKRISLDKLCRVLGIESPKEKHGMSGADVYPLFLQKKFEDIVGYCADDVSSMRECYYRMKN